MCIRDRLNLMENMITSGKYDALCVAPITPTNLISGVVMANEANIPVVNIDEKFDMDALAEAGGYVVGYATSDNVAVGEMAAQEIMNQFPDGAGVCIVEGIAGATSGELRRDGCRDALEAAEGYTVLDVQPGDWDRQTALDVATNMINKYGDELDAIFTANDTMAKGVLQAMINTGREDIFLVSTDADTEVQEAIAAGQLIAVVQDPGGIAFSCVEQAVACLLYTSSAGRLVGHASAVCRDKQKLLLSAFVAAGSSHVFSQLCKAFLKSLYTLDADERGLIELHFFCIVRITGIQRLQMLPRFLFYCCKAFVKNTPHIRQVVSVSASCPA